MPAFAAQLNQRQVAGEEEENAADDFRRPDEAIDLGGGEVADQRRQQAGAEIEGADEEGDGARPFEPPRLVRPPAPLTATGVRDQEDRAVAAGREENPAGGEDRSRKARPTDVFLSHKAPMQNNDPPTTKAVAATVFVRRNR